MSVQKSGPRSRHNALMTFGFFGLPPDRLSCVNCSSGHKSTSSGPNTTLKTEIQTNKTYIAQQLRCAVQLNKNSDTLSFSCCFTFGVISINVPSDKVLRTQC